MKTSALCTAFISTLALHSAFADSTLSTKALMADAAHGGKLPKSLNTLVKNDDGLPPHVLAMGLKAYLYAKEEGKAKKPILVIADLSMPSKDKRLWVINLNTDKVMINTYVANGKNSGLYRGTRFSNRPGSLESSLGVFVTGQSFVGNDGYSLRVHGLEQGINSNAYSREIVMHTAWYVDPSFIKNNGRAGRSWGCFAMSQKVGPKVINTVKNGAVIFSYAPQENNDPNLKNIK